MIDPYAPKIETQKDVQGEMSLPALTLIAGSPTQTLCPNPHRCSSSRRLPEKTHIHKIMLNIIPHLCNWRYILPTSSVCLAFQCIHYSSVYLLSTYCVLFPALSPVGTTADRATEMLPLGGLQTTKRKE